jgi:hypothetical protein
MHSLIWASAVSAKRPARRGRGSESLQRKSAPREVQHERKGHIYRKRRRDLSERLGKARHQR